MPMKLSNHYIPFPPHTAFVGLIGLILGITLQSYSFIPWDFIIPFLFPTASLIIILALSVPFNFSFLPLNFLFFFLLGSAAYEKQNKDYHNWISPKTETITAQIWNKDVTGNSFWKYKTTANIIDTYSTSTIHIYTKKPIDAEIADIIAFEKTSIKHPIKGDFKNYLIKEKISGTIFLDVFNYNLISKPAFSLRRWIAKKREELSLSLYKKMSLSTYALYSSLFLGERNKQKKEIEQHKTTFKTWGIVHHLARSGLHLALFVLCWYLLLSLLPLPFKGKHLLLIIISSIYFLLSTPSTSFIRAFHLFIIYAACSLLSLPVSSFHALTLSCMVTLLFNPYQLFFLDFQLSFYLTFCLSWLARLNRQRKNFS